MFSCSRIIIDLDAVRENYSIVCSQLSNSTACAAVVKADGYGLGASKVASLLHQDGCRDFFVAFVDEADSLNQDLPKHIKKNIYVLFGPYLHGWPSYFDACGYIPVINSLDSAHELNVYGASKGKKTRAVLHVDTGINRLGMLQKDFEGLLTKEFSHIEWTVVMSHLISSHDPHSPCNLEQLRLVKNISSRLPSARVCFANSGGIFLGKGYHFDMVRPGCALYGINPTPNQPNPLKQIVQMDARILQIANLKKGETVGYSATYKCTKPMRVATIACGYADGFPWQLSGKKAYAFINSKPFPIIGRISMDLITVDITNCQEPCDIGDWVSIINKDQTLDDLAQLTGNLPYQLLLNLGKRPERIYTEISESIKERALC